MCVYLWFRMENLVVTHVALVWEAFQRFKSLEKSLRKMAQEKRPTNQCDLDG